MSRRAPRPSAAAVGTGVAMLVLAGAAFAGITALTATDVITACKSESNGQVRLVDDASQCRSQEVAVSWNTEGPAGTSRPAGSGRATRRTRPARTARASGKHGLSKLEYVTAGPDTAAAAGGRGRVRRRASTSSGGAVRNRAVPGTIRASHPSDGTGTGARGSRGWYGVVVGGSGPFSVYAICAPAGSTEFRSAGGQYGAQYGG